MFRDGYMRRWEWLTEQVLKNGWTHGAELGVKMGTTLFFLLDHCPDLKMVGVDLWEPQPERGEYGYTAWDHKLHEDLVRVKARGYGKRITLLKMKTVGAAGFVFNECLDFVFIDADHSTDAVIADIEAWKPKIKKGGVLCGHDAGWNSVQKALNQTLSYWTKGTPKIWQTRIT